MAADSPSEVKFEIGHILFIDIVGYSKGLINEQSDSLQKLKEIVRGTEQFRLAEAEGKLLRLPTGDGGALVFRNSPEAPVLCAMEIAKALKSYPGLRVRMGIHSGPVNEVTDLNEQANIAGAGINLAQRVMDCADTGHILLSRHVAEDLKHYPRWRGYLHDLGDCEVKHGLRIGIVSLHDDQIGNPQVPKKLQFLKRHRVGARWTAAVAALLLLTGIVAAPFIVSKRSRGAAFTAPEKSIAVLPFENRSEDKANVYFADGIQDEILTRLSKIGDLKVISRTSTEKYRSRPDNLKIIAEELGVAVLLEGSVQKAGGKVRVVVQLIAAKSDQHLWAETYDRPLDDVFAVQSEIAGQIANALHVNLTPHESVALKSAPTSSQKAYDLFLRGDYLLRIARLNFTVSNVPESLELFRQAVAEDPRFALAYARLSLAESYLRFSGDGPKDGLSDQTQLNAEKALALQPDLMEAHLALAYCAYWGRFDYAQALQHLTRAQALAPKNSEVLTTIGSVFRRQLRFDEAVAAMELAVEYDPGNPDVFYQLGLTYDWAGRYDKVQSAYEHALALNPDNEAVARILAGFLRTHGGDIERARALLRGRGPSSQLDLAETYMDTRDYETAIHLIEELPADSPGFSEQSKDETLGLTLYRAGQNERARPWLERARERETAAIAPKTLTPRQILYHSCDLAEIEVALGARDVAIQTIESIAQSEAVAKDPIAEANYHYCLAWVYAHAGRNAEAITLLSQLLKAGTVKSAGMTPYLVRLDPDWDPLREDPRFQALLKEHPIDSEKAVR